MKCEFEAWGYVRIHGVRLVLGYPDFGISLKHGNGTGRVGAGFCDSKLESTVTVCQFGIGREGWCKIGPKILISEHRTSVFCDGALFLQALTLTVTVWNMQCCPRPAPLR